MILTNRLILLGVLPLLATGCSQPLLALKEPAPVYEEPHATYPEPAPDIQPQKALPPEPAPDIEIKALENPPSESIKAVELQPEPLTAEAASPSLLTPEQEKELATLEKSSQTPAPDTAKPASPSETIPATPDKVEPGAAANPAGATAQTAALSPTLQPSAAPTPPQAVLEPAPVPPAPPPFEPLDKFPQLSPVVGALVVAANKSADKGNVDSATTTIERAIRIEPRNAALFYKLAVLRLKQAKPALAEDLAKKSAILAANDTQLKKHSWLLIARARDMQKNPEGAEAARKKAEKF